MYILVVYTCVISSENAIYSRIDASDRKMSRHTFCAKLNDNHFLSQDFFNISHSSWDMPNKTENTPSTFGPLLWIISYTFSHLDTKFYVFMIKYTIITLMYLLITTGISFLGLLIPALGALYFNFPNCDHGIYMAIWKHKK